MILMQATGSFQRSQQKNLFTYTDLNYLFRVEQLQVIHNLLKPDYLYLESLS